MIMTVIFDVMLIFADSISHPEGTQVLLDSVRNELSQSEFQFSRPNVEILPGREEAEFSWITVNELLHYLGPNDTLVHQTTNSSTGELPNRLSDVI